MNAVMVRLQENGEKLQMHAHNIKQFSQKNNVGLFGNCVKLFVWKFDIFVVEDISKFLRMSFCCMKWWIPTQPFD